MPIDRIGRTVAVRGSCRLEARPCARQPRARRARARRQRRCGPSRAAAGICARDLMGAGLLEPSASRCGRRRSAACPWPGRCRGRVCRMSASWSAGHGASRLGGPGNGRRRHSAMSRPAAVGESGRLRHRQGRAMPWLRSRGCGPADAPGVLTNLPSVGEGRGREDSYERARIEEGT
jgi:hypothetical protein